MSIYLTSWEEAELKPTTFSLLLLFPVFPLLLNPSDIAPWVLPVKNNIYIPLWAMVGFKNRLTIWSLRVVGGDPRVQDSRVGGLLSVSFFVLSSFFPSVLHVPRAHQLPGLVCEVLPSVPRSLFSSIFSLLSSLLSWRCCVLTPLRLE